MVLVSMFVGYRDGTIKIGMSFQCKTRVGQQGKRFAARLLNQTDLPKLVPNDVVQSIQDLELPGIIFNRVHEETEQVPPIQMQVCEMFLACSRDCVTNTVCERLIKLPSPKVFGLLEDVSIPEEAVDFMKNIPDGGVVCRFCGRQSSHDSMIWQKSLRSSDTSSIIPVLSMFWESSSKSGETV